MAHGFTAMVDMAESPAKLQEKMPMEMPAPKTPVYPYGLSICLNEDQLDKLGLDDELPGVGDMIHLCAIAKVTSVSQNETQIEGGEKKIICRIELQITHLATENEDRENRGDDWYGEQEKSEAA
jgi:hypothetical protein